MLVGYNSRISTAQAALILWQLKHLPSMIKQRRAIAQRYINEIYNINEIELPLISDKMFPTYHKFVIQLDMRDELKDYLASKGIQCMIHYPKLLFDYSVMKNYPYRAENISNARQITQRILSLPLYPELTDEEITYVCQSLKSFFL